MDTVPFLRGTARVVDHEDPSQVAALVAAIDDERGRLDVLVNDIFGSYLAAHGREREDGEGIDRFR